MTVLHGISREINELNQRPEIQREMMKMFEKMPKMNDFIEKKWTDTDLCEFSEWCSENGLNFSYLDDLWWHDRDGHLPINKIGDRLKTTSQLRENWEIETGRREKP